MYGYNGVLERCFRTRKRNLCAYFHEEAIIRWHCSNELFTPNEYIQANCEYPGDWEGEIERIEETRDTIITVTKVYPVDKSCSFHVVSFLKLLNKKLLKWTNIGVMMEPLLNGDVR
jgi:hypothetical protein